MGTKPLISIIIPNYNRSSLLSYTLQSISKNARTDTETLVIDDGSTDRSLELLSSQFPWVQVFRQERLGAPAARNKGLRKSNGKYILYLDSDDLIESEFFLNKVEVLEKYDEIVGVYGPWEYFEGDKHFHQSAIHPRHTPYPIEGAPTWDSHLRRLLQGWYIPCNAILWRKSVLQEVNGQKEYLQINQDVDLSFRILSKKLTIIGNEGPRALIRIHDNERVGTVASDVEKLRTILDLRKRFKADLEEKNIWDIELAEALARYCFNYWIKLREEVPEVAEEFLEFSKICHPTLKLKGTKALVLLGSLFGNQRAIEIKSRISSIRKIF